MEIVKTVSIKGQFRSKQYVPNAIIKQVAALKQDEALVISAKEADRWKYPTNSISAIVRTGKLKKDLTKTSKYSVKHLKSGSYAVVCISK